MSFSLGIHLKRWRRRPARALTLVLVLGLSISLLAASLSVATHMLASPFGGLRLYATSAAPGGGDTVEAQAFQSWAVSSPALPLAAFTIQPASVLQAGVNRLLIVSYVSPNLFEMLGVSTFAGRASDLTPGNVVLSYRAWRSLSGYSINLIGKPIVVSGVPHTIAAVMPPGFEFPILPSGRLEGAPELWAVTGLSPVELARSALSGRVSLLLRVPDDRPLSAALASLNEHFVGGEGPNALQLSPIGEARRDSIIQPVVLLTATSFFVFLGALIHLAHLVLGEMRRNQREYTLLSSLGASETARVCWALAPTVPTLFLASILGALGGLGLLRWVRRVDVRYLPEDLVGGIGPFWTAVFAGSAALLFVAAVVALRLRSRRWSAMGRAERWTGASLCFHSMTMTLLTIAAVSTASHLFAVEAQDRGFDSNNVFVASLWFTDVKMQAPVLRDRLLRLTDAAERHEAVTSAAVASGVPFAIGEMGLISADGAAPLSAVVTEVSDRYFEVLQIRNDGLLPSLCGAKSVLISRSLSRQLYGEGLATGRAAQLERPRRNVEICGVVGDTKDFSESSPGNVYSALSGKREIMRFLVRAHPSRRDTGAVVRELVAAEMPFAAIHRVASLTQMFRDSIGRLRIVATLGVAFGVCALVVCLFALMSAVDLAISSRWRELAIRLALGASMGQALRQVLMPFLVFAFGGVLLSAISVIAAGSDLYLAWVGSMDMALPAISLSTSFFLLIVITLTALASSYRAYRIQPSRVLTQLP